MHVQEFIPEDLLGPLNEVEESHAPKKLYLAGDKELLTRGTRVAVVGSRNASSEGLGRTIRLARMLAERGIIVVSGLAEGIDTAAHEAAMEAGGRTVAVLGTPLDECYPAKNRELQDRIMGGHLAVSQFGLGSATSRKSFPMRNRTMAFLSDATVIVEAGESSGTLHQGWEALRLGRPLFLLESIVENGSLSWPGKMISYGAEILSERTIELFFEVLPEGSRVERARVAL